MPVLCFEVPKIQINEKLTVRSFIQKIRGTVHDTAKILVKGGIIRRIVYNLYQLCRNVYKWEEIKNM